MCPVTIRTPSMTRNKEERTGSRSPFRTGSRQRMSCSAGKARMPEARKCTSPSLHRPSGSCG